MRVMWVGHLLLYHGNVNSQVIPISQIILPISSKCAYATDVAPELLALRSVRAAYQPPPGRRITCIIFFLVKSFQADPSAAFKWWEK